MTYEDKAPYASTPPCISQICSTQGVRKPHRVFQNLIKLPYRVPGATTQGARKPASSATLFVQSSATATTHAAARRYHIVCQETCYFYHTGCQALPYKVPGNLQYVGFPGGKPATLCGGTGWVRIRSAMQIYIHVYICIYVGVDMYVYSYIYICVHIYMYVCLYTYVKYKYIYVYIYMLNINIYMYIFICIYTYICEYTYISIYIYI